MQVVDRSNIMIFEPRPLRWAIDFLDLARWWADRKSKDPSTKVGAVIAHPDFTIASMGYNGLPRGIQDTPERLNNRDLKYLLTVHAELNALHTCMERPKGYTLYSTLPPCAACAGSIIQSGISSVLSWAPTLSDDDAWRRWGDSIRLSSQIFEEARVTFTLLHPEIRELLGRPAATT